MDHTNSLPRSTPEAQGISSGAIQSFIDAVEERKLGVQSLILMRNGQIVADGWWRPYAAQLPHSMFSVSKSFTATAIGLAVAEGRLSVNDAVLSFFPSYVTPEIKANMEAMQVRHLLAMSTGHEKDTFPLLAGAPDEDWVRIFLSTPITYEPGTHFLYNTGASFMLSAIIQSLTGQTVLEYLRPRLFQPLGIENATWESNRSGINLGGTGLSITTLDLAKLGQLFLQRGVWNGQRIVAEEWIEEASSVHTSNGDDPNDDWQQGYGYQMWRCRHNAYRADGAFGQFSIIMPEQNAVLALTSGTSDMHAILDEVWNHILPGMHAEPLAENVEATNKLTKRLADLALPLPEVLSVAPATAARIEKRAIRLEANELHAQEVSFQFGPDETVCTILDDKGAQHPIRCGRTDWIIGTSASMYRREPSVAVPVAAHGGWVNEHTFAMTWQFIETPHCYIVSFDFASDEIDLSIKIVPFWQDHDEHIKGQLV